MKTLTICPSEFLPPKEERTRDHIYFVYDKMKIYLGKDTYTDPFCIVEDLPEKPVPSILYITFDGYVKSYVNEEVVTIAEIETPEQLGFLKDAGNIYFMKAEYRYLDLHTRTIELPYQNGSFHLSVNLSKEIMINENTVIRYDPKQSRFVIDGDRYHNESEGLINIGEYSGGETDSITVEVDGTTIKGHVRISPEEDNMIKQYPNGIYVKTADKASQKDFDDLMRLHLQYQTVLNSYINDLRKEIEKAGVNVSDGTVRDKIISALESYKPTIIDVLESYDEMNRQLQELEKDTYELVDSKFDSITTDIVNYLNGIMNAWEEFPEDGNYEDDNDFLTSTQKQVQGMVLEALREQFVMLSVIDPGSSSSVDGDVVFDTESDSDTSEDNA